MFNEFSSKYTAGNYAIGFLRKSDGVLVGLFYVVRNDANGWDAWRVDGTHCDLKHSRNLRKAVNGFACVQWVGSRTKREVYRILRRDVELY